MKKLLLFCLLILFFSDSYSQLSNPPKREFRSAWIATVANLDWPSRGASTDIQKQGLIDILNFLQTTGINVIIFQIRTECDALYQSSYEPWSYWLTGNQGTAPNPFYDPLQFAIEEAHKRGMELHAWFNPYRAIKTVGQYSPTSSHITVQHPDWIIASETEPDYRFLNPGKQVVRTYVTNVIMDVVRRYDIDGIHMDDYFYPYGGMHSEDAAAFSEESRGIADVGDWRRDNVNILLEQINDSVSAVKPHVKFGMSPFGIWKNGVPQGIIGLDAYNQIYADGMAWLRNQSIDYLTPQLYWQIGGNQDYNKLSAWWADSTAKYNRHLYPGQAPYRITANNWSASELPNQIRINRANPKIDGSVFFRAGTMTGKGFNDSLRTDLYRYKALLPAMSWKDNTMPNPVQNLRFERLSSTEPNALIWDKPAAAADGDTAHRYVIYRFNSPTVTQADLENPANILAIENRSYTFPPVPEGSGPFFFVVTALDRNWNESTMSTVLQVGGPQIPVPVSPGNTEQNQRDTVSLKWNASDLASSYYVQVSSDPAFNGNFIISGIEIQDTFLTVTGFEGEKTYYWRLNSKNAGGVSIYSEIFSFTTGFPVTPVPLEPAHQTLNVPLPVNVKWQDNLNTDSYRLQVSTKLDFIPEFIVMDVSEVSDTSYTLTELDKNKIYFWRITASNQYGTSLWSDKFGFKTESATDVEYEEIIPSDYILKQNFPNPFNPSTQISFGLPQGGYTILKIYDSIGNEVSELISENLPAGQFTVNFNASGISSGVYFYVLHSGNRMLSSKMILMK